LFPGTNPDTDPLPEGPFWSKYTNKYGRTLGGYNGSDGDKLSNIMSEMQNGNRVALTVSGNINNHEIGMSHVVQKTITYVNGTTVTKYIPYIMNPAYGGSIYRVPPSVIYNSYNIFYIGN